MLYNLLWIFVDGVRRYHASDDRGRLDVMDEFGKESIEFLNVVTSAPSTFQSLSAMATGIDSYYVNRNFSDFIFDNKRFPSITGTLKDAGYHCYSFLMHKDTREILRNIFPMIDTKYWPRGLTHNNWWNNDDINKAVNNTLLIGVNKPAFFFVDYNCRNDFATSDKIRRSIQMFRQAGYTRDNTIMILCSDHGYPDPSKKTGKPGFYQKHELSHDIVLSDDNIMIPLFIQYPGCTEGMKIETTISSIDIFPTLLDILGFETPSGVHGKSLMPLINNDAEYKKMMDSRFHRSDSRLSFQTGRGTAIRNGKYKYIYYHDDLRGRKEQFFDIINDSLEMNDLADSTDNNVMGQVEIFRKQLQDSENDAMSFQLEYLFHSFSGQHRRNIENAKEILITDSCRPLFIDMLVRTIRRINKNATISILLVEHAVEDIRSITGEVKPVFSGERSWEALEIETIKGLLGHINFDVLFAPYNTSEERDNVKLTKIVRKIKATNKVYLDYNMKSFKRTFSYYRKKLQAKRPFVRYKSFFFLYYITFVIDDFCKRVKKKCRRLFSNERIGWTKVAQDEKHKTAKEK